MNFEHELNQSTPIGHCLECCAKNGTHTLDCSLGTPPRITMTPLLRDALETWRHAAEGDENADLYLLDVLSLMAGPGREQQRGVPDAPAASGSALTDAQIDAIWEQVPRGADSLEEIRRDVARAILAAQQGTSSAALTDEQIMRIAGESYADGLRDDVKFVRACFAAQPASTTPAADDAHECGERTCHYFGKAVPDHCKECHAGTAPASAAAEAPDLESCASWRWRPLQAGSPPL
ncbi:hypothetical protein [Massilia pseudoviolaceinigra]|uniref:hypothetical protein n=1 Tax=Massilia pseudoviolaceinigra TaxID=3057165 RepID=UPI002796CBD2|nr:hypothetical protein [Massilia sp. CCM 9206]MDQ1921701.1 hypothetical protein [Massilia sp. CCM 9206]